MERYECVTWELGGGGGGGGYATRPMFAGSSVIRFSLKHLSKCFTSHNRVCFFRIGHEHDTCDVSLAITVCVSLGLGMNMIRVMFHLP